jgi:uncharacterized protein (DUF1499 family)
MRLSNGEKARGDPPRRRFLSPFALIIEYAVRAASIGLLLPVLLAFGDSSAGQGTGGNGMLDPCPSSPNCVSSRDPDPARRVDPILLIGDSASGWSRLCKVIAEMKGARVALEEMGYLHAEFRSALFGFVDDVELRLDEAAGKIDVRSASRTGYYDFGVNRRRVEEIRARFSREP